MLISLYGTQAIDRNDSCLSSWVPAAGSAKAFALRSQFYVRVSVRGFNIQPFNLTRSDDDK